jgi:tellurite resistance protein TerC
MSAQVWQVTLAVLLLVLAFDFAMAYLQRNVETSLSTAVSWTLFYVAAAVVFRNFTGAVVGYSITE